MSIVLLFVAILLNHELEGILSLRLKSCEYEDSH
jgi:hypothetical protein